MPISRSAPHLRPIGAHMSIAGGLHLAFARLAEAGGTALQIFSRNQRQWRVPVLSDREADLFRQTWEEAGRIPVAVHDSYLTSLASADPDTVERSVQTFAAEIVRVGRLSIPLLVTHPGSHGGAGVEEGTALYVRNLDRAMDLALAIHGESAEAVTVLLENTAGQGGCLGSTFGELAAIIQGSRHPARLGVCLDTCHAFAAGYDLRTAETYSRAMAELEQSIGLDRLRQIHLNDSKRELGSRVDRHEHIGQGQLGLEPFRLLLSDPRLSGLPMVIETPKDEGTEADKTNISLLRSLAPS